MDVSISQRGGVREGDGDVLVCFFDSILGYVRLETQDVVEFGLLHHDGDCLLCERIALGYRLLSVVGFGVVMFYRGRSRI